MSDQLLQTASDEVDGVVKAVAYRLSCDEWYEWIDPPPYPIGRTTGGKLARRFRARLPRTKADRIAGHVVPLALDHLARTGSGLVCGPFSREELVVDHVKRSLLFWQYVAWRVAIGIVARWLVDWWLSDQSAAYRERHCN